MKTIALLTKINELPLERQKQILNGINNIILNFDSTILQ